MYVHPVTGEAVFSVTTIIGNGIPKPGLPDWYAKQAVNYLADAVEGSAGYFEDLPFDRRAEIYMEAERYPETLRDEKAAKGDRIHEELEAYTGDPKGDPHLIQWESFLKTSGYTIIEREVTLWNRIHGYAGTADWLAVDPNGEYVLGDTKTGNRVYPDHGIQVEALCRCDTILREDGQEEYFEEYLTGGILHLKPKSWWWYPLADADVQDRNWNAFLAAKTISDWRACHPSMTLGDTKWNKDNWGE
jgi:hypothetical protein